MANNVYFEDVEVGQEIPAFERKTDFMHWNRYAAVNEEFVYVHMDDEAGKAAGQGAAFGMGNLRWATTCHSQAQRHLSGADPSVEFASLGRRAAEMELEFLTLIEDIEAFNAEAWRREGAKT